LHKSRSNMDIDLRYYYFIIYIIISFTLNHNNFELQRPCLLSILNIDAVRPLETTFNDWDPLDRTTTTTRHLYTDAVQLAHVISAFTFILQYIKMTRLLWQVYNCNIRMWQSCSCQKKIYRILRNFIHRVIVYVNGIDRFKHL